MYTLCVALLVNFKREKRDHWRVIPGMTAYQVKSAVNPSRSDLHRFARASPIKTFSRRGWCSNFEEPSPDVNIGENFNLFCCDISSSFWSFVQQILARFNRISMVRLK